jgi:hypothetical protein
MFLIVSIFIVMFSLYIFNVPCQPIAEFVEISLDKKVELNNRNISISIYAICKSIRIF